MEWSKGGGPQFLTSGQDPRAGRPVPQVPTPCARQAPCKVPDRASHFHLSNSPGNRKRYSHFLDGETEGRKDQVPSLWLPGKPFQPGVCTRQLRYKALASLVLEEPRPRRAQEGGRVRLAPEKAGRAGQEAAGFPRVGASGLGDCRWFGNSKPNTEERVPCFGFSSSASGVPVRASPAGASGSRTGRQGQAQPGPEPAWTELATS